MYLLIVMSNNKEQQRRGFKIEMQVKHNGSKYDTEMTVSHADLSHSPRKDARSR